MLTRKWLFAAAIFLLLGCGLLPQLPHFGSPPSADGMATPMPATITVGAPAAGPSTPVGSPAPTPAEESGGPVVLPRDPSATVKLLPPLAQWKKWLKPGSRVPGQNTVRWVTIPNFGRVLELRRTNGDSDGGGAGIFYDYPIEVGNDAHLYLALRGRILAERGGNIANTQPRWFPEGALQIRIRYVDTQGREAQWYHGFYATAPMGQPDSHFTREPLGEPFIWQSEDLLTLLPSHPATIEKVEVYGFGWAFRSQVMGFNMFTTPGQ